MKYLSDDRVDVNKRTGFGCRFPETVRRRWERIAVVALSTRYKCLLLLLLFKWISLIIPATTTEKMRTTFRTWWRSTTSGSEQSMSTPYPSAPSLVQFVNMFTFIILNYKAQKRDRGHSTVLIFWISPEPVFFWFQWSLCLSSLPCPRHHLLI